MTSVTHTSTPNDRRSRTRDEIKRLIEDRNSVLAQFYNLAKHAENSDADTSNTLELVEEFCQELVDYMATGHFEIYRRIEEGNERRDDITQLAEKIMPRINDTTQVAVAFNDIYDHSDNIDEDAVKKLPTYLAKLGEELATRIDLEDKFINTLLSGRERPQLTSVNS